MGWFSSSWQYRRAITINNTSNSNTLSNYQVLVTLDTASLISAGKMQSTGADIRFTDSDGLTSLSYWIESGINTSSTRIWVKVPSIPASSTKTIYIYYGNPSATGLSNGDATFDFFDDFSVKDTSKWNWPTDWTVETGYAKQTYSSNWPPSGALVHTFSPSLSISSSIGIAIETYVKNLGTVAAYDLGIGVTDGGGTRHATAWAVGSYDVIFDSARTDWGEADTRNWNPILLTVRGGEQKIWINNVFEASNTVSITSVNKIDIVSKGQSYWDWIRVRKYTSPEPTTSVSTTEETIWNKYTEAIGINDFRKMNVSKYMYGETSSISDVLKVQFNPTANLYAWLDEPVYTIQDKVALSSSKYRVFTEALSFVDLIDYTKKPGLFFRDELTKLISKYIDEPLFIVDYLEVVPPVPGVKYLADSFVLLDVLSKDLSKTYLEETMFVDEIVKGVSKSNVELFLLTDVFDRLVNYLRVLFDEYNLIDFIKKDITKSLFIDSLVVLDYISKEPAKLLPDSFTFLDYLIKQPNVFKDESMSLIDVYSRIVQFVREYADSLALIDVIIKQAGKYNVDFLSLVEVLIKSVGVSKEDSILMADIISKDYIKTPLTEVASLIDYVSKMPSKPLPESFTFLDYLRKQTNIFKSEVFSVSDVYSKIALFVRQYLDAFIFSEIVVAPKPGLFFTESFSIFDYLTKRFGKPVSESLLLSDYLRYVPAKFISESLNIFDEYKRIIQFKLGLLEYVGLKPYELVYLPELGLWVLIVEKKEGGIGILIG